MIGSIFGIFAFTNKHEAFSHMTCFSALRLSCKFLFGRNAYNDVKAPEMLEALTSLKIIPTDELSTVMCLKCSLNLKLAFTIRQNMRRAEQIFKERIIAAPVQQEIADEDSFSIESVHEVTKIEIEHESKSSPKKKDSKPLMKNEIYTCDVCEQMKPTKRLLRQHKYNVHVKVKCPVCSKQITQSNINQHIKRIHRSDSTVCDICGLTLKTLDLTTHVRLKHHGHTYNCQFCDKVFKQKRCKVAHEKREHLDEADFVCHTCGKKFFSMNSLRNHSNVHQNSGTHICEFCKVGFRSKFALKTHRRQHTKETPYKCEFCAEGFRQKVSLRRHLESKHDVKEELTTECKVCGKRFASKAGLFSHNRIHM